MNDKICLLSPDGEKCSGQKKVKVTKGKKDTDCYENFEIKGDGNCISHWLSSFQEVSAKEKN